MPRPSVCARLLLVLAAVTLPPGRAAGQPQPRVHPLDRRVDLDETFRDATLSDVLGIVSRRADLTFLLSEESFLSNQRKDVRNAKPRLPPMKDVCVGTVLRLGLLEVNGHYELRLPDGRVKDPHLWIGYAEDEPRTGRPAPYRPSPAQLRAAAELRARLEQPCDAPPKPEQTLGEFTEAMGRLPGVYVYPHPVLKTNAKLSFADVPADRVTPLDLFQSAAHQLRAELTLLDRVVVLTPYAATRDVTPDRALREMKPAPLRQLPAPLARVNGLTFGPGNDLALAGAVPADSFFPVREAKGAVAVIDAVTGRVQYRFADLPLEAHQVAFSPDGALLAASGRQRFVDPTKQRPEGALMVWSARSGRARPLADEPGAVFDFAFSADGGRLAAACIHPERLGGEVRVIDVPGGKTVERFVPPGGLTATVAFGPDGKSVVSGGGAGRLDVWEPGGRAPRSSAALPAPVPVQRVAFADGGKRVWAVGPDLAVYAWDPPAPEPAVRVEGRRPDAGAPGAARPQGFYSPALSPDGRALVALVALQAAPPAPIGGEIRVWDLAGDRPREARVLALPSGWVGTTATFSRTGDRVAVAASGPDPVTRAATAFVLIWDAKALVAPAK
jgi:hypothetical protein